MKHSVVNELAGWFLITTGLSCLVGYIIGIPEMAGAWGKHVGMAINTAACFVVIGIIFIRGRNNP